ncbi:hypothetical protein D0C27_11205 [Alcaligenes faecalis]|uniref:Lipoprotein n=1 Tax=Alcaligenes faecalis TaxID=511 RepID=A0AB33D024_ALCFA|nr:hypothetical protein [Alcaligenes faecalis]ASR89202.1 hypothetical protein AFA_06945 [Alcaligenes faecalis]QCP82415.1 hypothetical protein D0C27_11205 [Alcaligenes faecalis]
MKVLAGALLLSATFLAGCATTSGLEPTVSKSGFDGATVVNIVPHGNTCAEHCTQIGAQWNSQSPTKAILTIGVLGYTGFRNIEKVELRIGKDVRVLEPNPGLTRHVKEQYMTFYESKKDYTVNLDLVRNIIASNDVWLRISTNDGVIEDAIVSGAQDSKGFNALKRFIAEVDSH